MDILLVHGMGRTPLSMLLLGWRLRAAGHKAHLFGYAPTFESWPHCAGRLLARIRRLSPGYALAGHSLGAVLIRTVLPALQDRPPAACFFLAPPGQACRAARYFAAHPLYRLLMGDMGQRLADDAFMAALPRPSMPTRIYAGTGGFSRRWSPFGAEPNDGILTVAEVQGPSNLPVVLVPATHTFIMNARQVVRDIVQTLATR